MLTVTLTLTLGEHESTLVPFTFPQSSSVFPGISRALEIPDKTKALPLETQKNCVAHPSEILRPPYNQDP